MRRGAVVAVLAALAVVKTSDAAVFSWHAGGALYLANDPSDVPAGEHAERYTARPLPPNRASLGTAPAVGAAATAATSGGRREQSGPPPGECPTTTAVGRPEAPQPAQRAAGGPRSAPPIVIAPSIIVGAGAPSVVVVDAGMPWSASWGFLPSGFIAHEHPQVPFLAGSRLTPHSHFFAHGRPGRFTPYGHFSTHGVLVDFLPY